MLKLTNINKTFEREVLKDFNLQINKGERIGLIGGSGIGKTTIINIILGIISPDSGSIENTFKRVAAVFQENRLIDEISSLDNLKMISEKENEILINTLEKLGIYEYNKKVSSLSGGMKRRVSIARAIIFGGDLLILDEPIQGLDKETRKNTIKTLMDSFSDSGILLISHNEKDLKDFNIDRVIEL